MDLRDAERGLLARDKIRRIEMQGVVDTGATHLVIPESVADQLGLPRTGEMTVRYADHRTATRPIAEQLDLDVLGRRDVFRAILEPARDTVLVGAIVLEDLDLLVDCTHQMLKPRDPERTIAEIE